MTERERIVGTLVGSGDDVLVLDGAVRFDNNSINVSVPPQPVQLRADDGRTLSLSGFEHAKKIGRFTAEGSWGELLDQHAFLRALAEAQSQPRHVTAKVRVFVLRANERIEVEISHAQRHGSEHRARVRRAAMPGLALDAETDARPEEPSTPRARPPIVRRHRVVGVVEGAARSLVFARLRMHAGESMETREIGGDSLAVRTDDGALVRVESLANAAHLGSVSLSDTYAAVRDHALVRPFASSAPGDHVRVRIEGFAISAGDRVAVDGVVVNESFSEADPSFRAAPSASVSTVRAARIAVGDAPEALLDAPSPAQAGARNATRARETPSRESRSAWYPLHTSMIAYGVIGSLALFATLLAGWFGPLFAARHWLTTFACLGWAMTAIAISRALRGALHSSYVSRAGGGARITDKSAVWGYGADMPLMIGLAICAPFSALVKSPHVHTIVLATAAIVSVVHLIALWVQERPFRAFAARVLSVQPGDPSSANTVAIEGTARSSGAALKRYVRFFWQTHTTQGTDSNGEPYERESSTLFDRESTAVIDPMFAVEVGGAAVHVEPAKARCAFTTRVWETSDNEASYHETLSNGDRVLVVGRFTTDERGERVARSTGEESLFLWGGTRSQLRAALWSARGKLALLALCAAVPIALGMYVHPYAARFRASATVTDSSLPSVPIGTRCTLSLLAFDGDGRTHCKAVLECGAQRLYGGWRMGQTACSFARGVADPTVSGGDESRYDGDPALSFDLQQQRARWADDKSTAVIDLALEHPAAALTFP